MSPFRRRLFSSSSGLALVRAVTIDAYLAALRAAAAEKRRAAA